MASPSFDQWSVLDYNREYSQIETAVGHTVFNRRAIQGTYAELRSIENATGVAVFDKWAMLDPQYRMTQLATKSLSYSPVGSPAPVSPWVYNFTPSPPGVAAP
jgi:hypothetical protein